MDLAGQPHRPRLAVVCADAQFADLRPLEPLADRYEIVDLRHYARLTSAELEAALREVDVVLTGRLSPLLPSTLSGRRGRLRYVCHLKGSVRAYVPLPLIEDGLIVTNWGRDQGGLAEGALALLLAALKQVPALDRLARSGPDERVAQAYRPSLDRMTVGVIGCGAAGARFATLLHACGSRVLVYDPFSAAPPFAEVCARLSELFARSHAVSLHCALTEATTGLVTRALLERLPQGAVVVNTARGALVDEAALAELADRGRLLAAVDVVATEPAFGDSPLCRARNVIVTGHRIAASRRPDGSESRDLPELALKNLRAFAAGEPLEAVITAERYRLMT